jgi:hypothetical protein
VGEVQEYTIGEQEYKIVVLEYKIVMLVRLIALWKVMEQPWTLAAGGIVRTQVCIAPFEDFDDRFEAALRLAETESTAALVFA